MTSRDEIRGQIAIVVNLAIENDRGGTIFIEDGLLATG